MLIKPKDFVCIKKIFKIVEYYPKDNLFECSTSMKDEKSSNYKGPSLLRLNRFSLPGDFCGLKVESYWYWDIPEIPFELSKNSTRTTPVSSGWNWDVEMEVEKLEVTNLEGADDDRKWKVVLSDSFKDSGMYQLQPKGFYGEPRIKQAIKLYPEKQKGYTLVGKKYKGSDFYGQVERIYSFIWDYRQKHGEKGYRVKSKFQYHEDGIDPDVYTHKRHVQAVLVDRFGHQWDFPVRQLKKINSK